MAGKYSGAQAIIKESLPLALYVHFGPHCVNLISQSACFYSISCYPWLFAVGSWSGCFVWPICEKL